MTDFHVDQVKKKNWKRKIQNGRLKKTDFFKIASTQIYLVNFHGLTLRVSRIDWCKGHWCGSIYMVETVQRKLKNRQKMVFFVFLGCSMKFSNVEDWWFWKTQFFLSRSFWKLFFIFFSFLLLYPHENQSKLLWYQGWVKMAQF